MTSKLTLPISCSVAAIALAVASPALASGTLAGSSITNTATINYNVGGVAQPPIDDSDTFVVDRRINLTVAEDGTTTTIVAPGQSNAVTAFTLTNSSNAVLDFNLAVSQTVGGSASHGGTDSFDVVTPSIFRDVNTNGTFESGTDLPVTFIDELGIGGMVRLLVVANVPGGLATGAVANVRLTATAREGGAAASLGAALTQTAGANTAAMDTVFADTAGVADALRDAAHSDDDDYTVQTAALTLNKFSRIVSDPVNGATDPKFIPNAVVEYCISVANAAGGAAATNVAITDVLPSTLTFVTGSILLNGTVTGSTCNANGTAGGSHASGTVSGTLASVAAGDTRTLVFRATVN